MQRIGFAGALAGAASLLLFLLLQPGTVDRSWAAEVEAVAAATGRAGSAHFVLQARVNEAEDLAFVDLGAGLERVEAWVDWPREGRAGRIRVEGPGSVYVFDGEGSLFYRIRFRELSRRPQARPDWNLVWPAAWLEKLVAFPGGAEVVVDEKDDHRSRLVLRFRGAEVRGRERAFFDEFDREVELEWDTDTRHLVRFDRWVDQGGDRVLFSRLVSLDHPTVLDGATFTIDLPADVREVKIGPPAGLERLTAEETAREFFEAAVRGEWDRVASICPTPSLVEWLRSARPRSLRHLGTSFRTGTYAGTYVPYRIELGVGEKGRIHEHNLALRDDNPAGRWIVDGGL